MKFYDGFLGEDDANQTVNFVGGDTKEIYEKNLIKMPNDWYYKNKSITYKFNEYGHRCKSIKDIDFDNYFLVVGCSHSQGVGLELEKTFPYLLAQQLSCDYYNMSVSASGIDVTEHNVLLWKSKFDKLPKFLILQWPSFTRYSSYSKNMNNVRPNGPWYPEENNLRFLSLAEEHGLLLARKKLSLDLIENNSPDTLIINLEYGSNDGYHAKSVFFNELDVARDLSHMGIKSNNHIVESVIKILE